MMKSPLAQRFAESAVVRQGLRFAIVGVIATTVHYAILIGLVEALNATPLVATTLGYCVGIVVSFALNRRYTFAAQNNVASRFVKFVVLYASGAVLNGAVMSALMQAGAFYLVAQIGATALVLIWNFAGARYVVFRD